MWREWRKASPMRTRSRACRSRLSIATSSSTWLLAHDDRSSLHATVAGVWKALTTRNPDPQSPAGGASSSARDLANWMRVELANGRFGGRPVVDATALAETHRPLVDRGIHPLHGVPSFYGLGWNVEFRGYGTVWGHAGAFSHGARTLVTLLPSQQLGIVVLTNAFPTGVPEGLADTFLAKLFGLDAARDWLGEWNALYASMFGPAIDAARARYDSAPAGASPALAAAAYAGTYVNDYLGKALIVETGGALTLKLGPANERSFSPRHFDGHVFVYHPYDETPQLPVAATFEIGPDHQATRLTLDDLNDNGQGVLVRARS
jgi:hypothetical protein